MNGKPWWGLGAVGGSAGCFALGLLFGAPVALLTATATTDEAHPFGASAAYLLWAAFGLAGQAIWAVHDVNQNSSVAADPASASAPVPVPAPLFQLAGVSIRPRGSGAVLEVDALF